MSKYQILLNKKRAWVPVRPTTAPLVQGSEELIERALSFRCLEIPVGEFIEQSCKGDLPKDDYVKELLHKNIEDEERHDIALQYAFDSLGYSNRFAPEAEHIKKAITEAPEHPLLKALVLERSLFFVLLPILRFFGNSGLRTVSADVSIDETSHVATNTLVCADMGINLTRNLDNLRKEAAAYLVEGFYIPAKELEAQGINPKYGSKDFWLQQSDNLMYKGKAEGLSETRSARMPAFFETNSQNLPMYG